jgi:nitrogen fixation protein FixH
MNLNMSPTTSWGMSSRSPIPESPRRGLRGGHVLLIFIGFFATIFLVNGIMVYDALSTFGGLETPDAYRKGLAYNQRIAEGEAQEQRGWRDKLAYVAETQRVRVDLNDSTGAAVPGLFIAGEIGRPVTDRFDRKIEFTQTGPGTYEAEAAGLDAGWWTIDIEARKGAGAAAEKVYEARERIWIKP